MIGAENILMHLTFLWCEIWTFSHNFPINKCVKFVGDKYKAQHHLQSQMTQAYVQKKSNLALLRLFAMTFS